MVTLKGLFWINISCLMVVILHAAPLTDRRRREAGVSKHDPQVHVSIGSTSSELFPATMHATLILEDGTNLALTLERNDNININVPVHVDDPDIDDQVHKQNENAGYYIERKYTGSFVVLVSMEGDQVDYTLEGIMYVYGQTLIVQKDEDGVMRVKKSSIIVPSFEDITEQQDEDEFKNPQDSSVSFTDVRSYGQLDVTEKKETNKNRNARRKRTTQEKMQFDVETLFIIDHTIFDFWKSIYVDAVLTIDAIANMYKNYMNSMQLAFASINDDEIQIMPRLIGIEVLTTVAESNLTVNSITWTKVNPPTEPYDSVLGSEQTFFFNAAEWKKDHGYTWNNPDHMMVFTMYDVVDNKTVGVAAFDQVCRGYNSMGYHGGISIVEDLKFASWRVMAHEMAHNLGAKHDGQNGCRAEDGFLMTPLASALTSASVDNAHLFSPCSIREMKQTLMGTCKGCTIKTCLLDNIYNSQVYRSTPKLLGEDMSLDDQCRHAKGDKYRHYEDGSDHCVVLKCTNGRYFKYSILMAADGTSCGSNATSWCMRGRCVTKTDIQYTTSQRYNYTCSDAPSGCVDTAGFSIVVNNITVNCSDIGSDYPSLCWGYKMITSGCPATCHAVLCDTEAESPCTSATSPTTAPFIGSGTCADNPSMLLNELPCPKFCADIISKGRLKMYKEQWNAICDYCCESCRC